MGGEAGKGDTPCPILISDNEWDRLWNIAFPLAANTAVRYPTEPSYSVIEHNDPGDENDHE